jgi:hypothetical protein
MKGGSSYEGSSELHRVDLPRSAPGAIPRKGGWEAIDFKTPAHFAIEREEGVANDDRATERNENFRRLLQWLFVDGPHPSHVMRRLFGLAFHLEPSLRESFSPGDEALLLSGTARGHFRRLELLLDRAAQNSSNAQKQRTRKG